MLHKIQNSFRTYLTEPLSKDSNKMVVEKVPTVPSSYLKVGDEIVEYVRIEKNVLILADRKTPRNHDKSTKVSMVVAAEFFNEMVDEIENIKKLLTEK